MKKLQNPSLRKRKGFTLIELIVVIAILAILAAIAIPTFLGTLSTAKTRADDATVSVVKSAVQLYRAEIGSYPANSAAMTSYFDASTPLKWANGNTFTFTVNATTGVITFDPVKPTY